MVEVDTDSREEDGVDALAESMACQTERLQAPYLTTFIELQQSKKEVKGYEDEDALSQ